MNGEFLVLILLIGADGARLSPQENLERINECGKTMLPVPQQPVELTEGLVIKTEPDQWIVVVGSRGGDSYDASGSFISPRHILTNSQPILGENFIFNLDGEVFLSEDHCDANPEYVEVPEKYVQDIRVTSEFCIEDGSCPDEVLTPLKAWFLKYCHPERNTHKGRIMRVAMLIEIEQVTARSFACVVDTSYVIKETDVGHIYGFDLTNGVDGGVMRYRNSQNVGTFDEFLHILRYHADGDRGGPMVMLIDGLATIVGLSASSSYVIKETDVGHIYGFDLTNGVDGGVMRYRNSQNVGTFDEFLHILRYHADGDRGGPMVMLIDGLATIVGLSASSAWHDKFEWGYFHRVSWYQEGLCEVAGICAKGMIVIDPAEPTTTELTTTELTTTEPTTTEPTTTEPTTTEPTTTEPTTTEPTTTEPTTTEPTTMDPTTTEPTTTEPITTEPTTSEEPTTTEPTTPEPTTMEPTTITTTTTPATSSRPPLPTGLPTSDSPNEPEPHEPAPIEEHLIRPSDPPTPIDKEDEPSVEQVSAERVVAGEREVNGGNGWMRMELLVVYSILLI